ncbi:MAG: BrnT family toxin [Chitinophagales bacterium]|nr:BrnT family toxin [Chitinophagales bacterium]
MGRRQPTQSVTKHAISLHEAESIFEDVGKKVYFNHKHSSQELRYICVGESSIGRILYCSFVLRKSQIRIISSRKANAKEKEKYFNN